MSKPSPQHALVLFRVGPVFACADARPVVAIVLPPPLTRPPGSGGSRPGVFRHNSGLVRVVDLRERLGVATDGPGGTGGTDRQTDRVIIVRLATGLFGFWVDSILGVIDRPSGGWGPLPAHLPRDIFPRTLLHREQIHLQTDLARLADWHDTPALHAAIRAYTASQIAPAAKQTPPPASPGTAAKAGNNSASPPPVVARREPAPNVLPAKTGPAVSTAGRPVSAQVARATRNSRTAPGERRTGPPPHATTPSANLAANLGANRSASPAGARRTATPASSAADGSRASLNTGLNPGPRTAPAPRPGLAGGTAPLSRTNSGAGTGAGAVKSGMHTASTAARRRAAAPPRSSPTQAQRPAHARPLAAQHPPPESTMPTRPATPRSRSKTMPQTTAGGTHPPAARPTTDTAGSGAARIGMALLGLVLFAILAYVLLRGPDRNGQLAGSTAQPPQQDTRLALTPPVTPDDADRDSTAADETDGESGGEISAQGGMASVTESVPSTPSATVSRPVSPTTSTAGTSPPVTPASGTPAVVAHPPAPAANQPPGHGPTGTASVITTLVASHSAASGVPGPHASVHRDREGLVIVLNDADQTGTPASGPAENATSTAPDRLTTPANLAPATAPALPAAESPPPAPATAGSPDREATPGPVTDNAAGAAAVPSPATASGTRAGDTPNSANTTDIPEAQDAIPPGTKGQTDSPAPDARPNTPTASHIVTTEIVHIVVPGDTLWAIAEHYIHDPFRYPELARLSRIRNPDLIYPGDRVRIIHRHRVDTSGAGKQAGAR